MGRWGRGGIAVVVVLGFLAAGVGAGAAVRNLQAAKTVVVPAAWEQAWQDAHVLEGQDVVLAWGDRAGADPTRARPRLRFDAARALDQLDALYALDVHDLAMVDEDGAIGRHKIVVVVEGTWSAGPGSPASAVLVPQSGGLAQTERGATGTVVDGVGLVRVDVPSLTARGHESATAPVTAEPALVGGSAFDPSWELARGFAEVVQGFAVLDAPEGSPRTTPRRSGPRALPTWPPWPHRGASGAPLTWCAARSCTGEARGSATAAGCCCSTWPNATATSCWDHVAGGGGR